MKTAVILARLTPLALAQHPERGEGPLSAVTTALSFAPRAERGAEASGGMGEAKLPPSLLRLSSLPLPRSLAGIAPRRRGRAGWGLTRINNQTAGGNSEAARGGMHDHC